MDTSITFKSKQLIGYLKDITRKDIDSTQTIILNFSFKESTPNQPYCLDYYSSIKSYRNFFKRKKQFAQFYITQQNFIYPKDYVFEDKDDLIRKTLFKYGNNCNYIIIKPDGRFFKTMNEHHQDKIPIKAKADW